MLRCLPAVGARRLRLHDMRSPSIPVLRRLLATRAPVKEKASKSAANEKWEVVIGLETHAQLVAESKLFSPSSTQVLGKPNSFVSVLDIASPGSLPVLNRKAVEQGVKTGIALHGKINLTSFFDRKHYFYADLPAGYQITQQWVPLVEGGYIELVLPTYTKKIRISHLRLEVDSGKSIHDAHPTKSFIDFNRAGMGLMEIVSEPDIRTSEEAGAYLRQLTTILRHIGSCHGSMEEGSLRCDVNVSVRPLGAPLGTRAEVKNVNKIKHVMKAIDFEVERQMALLKKGERIVQETRFFDANKSVTIHMRTKEDEVDYRYLPEPDLPPLQISDADFEMIKSRLPELPDQIRDRYVERYQLPRHDASTIISEEGAPAFFERMLTPGRSPKKVANWITSELFGQLRKRALEIGQSPVTPDRLGPLLDLVDEGLVTGSVAKKVLGMMFDDQRSAQDIVKANNWQLITDEPTIEKLCREVLEKETSNLEAYRKGKETVFKFFVGQVIAKSSGRAHPDVVTRTLSRLLAV